MQESSTSEFESMITSVNPAVSNKLCTPRSHSVPESLRFTTDAVSCLLSLSLSRIKTTRTRRTSGQGLTGERLLQVFAWHQANFLSHGEGSLVSSTFILFQPGLPQKDFSTLLSVMFQYRSSTYSHLVHSNQDNVTLHPSSSSNVNPWSSQ